MPLRWQLLIKFNFELGCIVVEPWFFLWVLIKLIVAMSDRSHLMFENIISKNFFRHIPFFVFFATVVI